MLTYIVLAERAKTKNCDKIMYKNKFNDEGLARYRYKQKQTPETSTWASLVYSTQSPNIVSNSSYFPKLVFVKLPDGMSR